MLEDAIDDNRVLARLDGGQPLLVHRSVGSGSVSLLATTVYVDWTNLPLRPLFLPFVTRFTLHLADARRAASAELVAGTPLVVSMAGEDDSAQLQFTDPSGNVQRIRKENQMLVRYLDTYETGVYGVQVLNSRRSKRLAFAYNHDPGETDPAVLSHDALGSDSASSRSPCVKILISLLLP